MPRLADPAMRTPAGGGRRPSPGRARPRRAHRAEPGRRRRRVHPGRVHALRGARRPPRRGVAGGLPPLRASPSTRRRSPTTRWPTGSSRGGATATSPARNPHLYRVMFGEGLVQVHARAPRGRRGGGGHVRAAARAHRAVRRRRAVGRRRRLDGRRRHLGDGARARAHRAARLLRVPGAIAARHLRAGAAGARAWAWATTRRGSRRRSPPVGSGPTKARLL